MFNFEDALKLIGEQIVLCVGDLMLDDFVYGEVSRISPEAPAPVLSVRRHELLVGGAGNVARNIAALGSRCIFVGVVGDDEASRILMRALAAESLIEPYLAVDPSRPTTRKVRFVSEHYSTHLLRADWEMSGVRCEYRESLDRTRPRRDTAGGECRVVRLCQGRAHASHYQRRDQGRRASLASPSSWIPRARTFPSTRAPH